MAERALLRRAARPPGFVEAFRILAATAPEGLALLDAEGRLVAANAALGRMGGPMASLRPGAPVIPILAPAGRAAFASALALAAGGGAPAPLRGAPADPAAPTDTEWALRLGCLPPEAGPEARVLLRVEDRTEARRAEARLAEAGRLETVGRLAGGIAHDFNNLLAAILGAAEAARAAGLPPAAEADVAQIEEAARRGAGLVRQLLAFARQQRLQPRVIELNEAVTAIAPLLRRVLGRQVQVELALEQPGRRVRVDPTQLDQVMLNLAVNAREAMPEGGRLRIATGHRLVLRPEGEGAGRTALPPGRWVVLEVSDTGRGIPPEVLPRLFEPFFTTRPEKGGTGLGLATVQGIVAQSGGQVAVESRQGEGTTFRIYLPRQEGPAMPLPDLMGAARQAASDLPAPLPPAPGAVPPPASPILLVEDEAPLRLLGTRLLERAGHGVLAADSAESALALLEEGARPAMLVSDVAMPGMDGLDLARRLRARWPALPVLLLSGYAERVIEEVPDIEGIRFLAKPFGAAELLREVAAALGPGAPALG
ncbi:ATP-binding protein [Paracraurococcus lichenis]|uniref:histidine kinase n=1 Tax=Paracraurococcus lichenis TaxID=3064888 RepID=A0ABT9DZM4_9PROT|nr:ATP-binding protein [Paracraurococcus sp. LOR1-02]MDO9709340.1 ATP-binding protein [Paracraurococcus sp. LOR1-02]